MLHTQEWETPFPTASDIPTFSVIHQDQAPADTGASGESGITDRGPLEVEPKRERTERHEVIRINSRGPVAAKLMASLSIGG